MATIMSENFTIVKIRQGNTTQSLLFTTEYHNKQLETAKQNSDTCDCAIVYGLMVDCK